MSESSLIDLNGNEHLYGAVFFSIRVEEPEQTERVIEHLREDLNRWTTLRTDGSLVVHPVNLAWVSTPYLFNKIELLKKHSNAANSVLTCSSTQDILERCKELGYRINDPLFQTWIPEPEFRTLAYCGKGYRVSVENSWNSYWVVSRENLIESLVNSGREHLLERVYDDIPLLFLTRLQCERISQGYELDNGVELVLPTELPRTLGQYISSWDNYRGNGDYLKRSPGQEQRFLRLKRVVAGEE